MTKRIPVGPFPHYYAIVDDEDYEVLSEYSWHLLPSTGDLRTVHARAGLYQGKRIDTKGNVVSLVQTLLMHQLITGFEQTDHVNGIGLDNRRENLRAASNNENQWNRAKNRTQNGKKCSSQFKGVCWNKRLGKWCAKIQQFGKDIHIGVFVDEVEAAKAYDTKAVELFGEFSRINFP